LGGWPNSVTSCGLADRVAEGHRGLVLVLVLSGPSQAVQLQRPARLEAAIEDSLTPILDCPGKVWYIVCHARLRL